MEVAVLAAASVEMGRHTVVMAVNLDLAWKLLKPRMEPAVPIMVIQSVAHGLEDLAARRVDTVEETMITVASTAYPDHVIAQQKAA